MNHHNECMRVSIHWIFFFVSLFTTLPFVAPNSLTFCASRITSSHFKGKNKRNSISTCLSQFQASISEAIVNIASAHHPRSEKKAQQVTYI